MPTLLQCARGAMAASLDYFKGGSSSADRRPRQTVPRDHRRELPAYQWRQQVAFARALYTQMGEIRGVVREKASYVVGTGWQPQFYGSDKAWGKKAENLIWEWFKVCDVRGHPFDFHAGLHLSSLSMDRDGDAAMLLTKNAEEYPMLQYLASHRIGSRHYDGQVLADGPYKGLLEVNGVIFNTVLRAVAYRILGPDNDASRDTVVSARDLVLTFDPEWQDQGRGITAFQHAIELLQDFQDLDDYTLIGIKAAATTSLLVTNEAGEANTRGANRGVATVPTSSDDPVYEELRPGIRYQKAGAQENVQIVSDSRPSPNAMAFRETMLRGVCQGIDWPYEIARDPSKVGGAPFRGILTKANRSIVRRQTLLATPATRAVGYAVSKFIQQKRLPFSPEWWMWQWQFPKTLTADAGRESKEDRELLAAGMGTLQQYAAEDGQYWIEMRQQQEIEADDLLERAERLVEKHTWLSHQEALQILRKTNNNAPAIPAKPAAKAP